jgi:hypothetical protein
MNRKCGFVFLVSFLVALLWVFPAAGFEISLKGSLTWEYFLYSQSGPRGFFGPYDVDNASPAPGGAASSNGWLGNRVTSLTSSGTDIANSDMFMDIFPKIQINPALTVRGQYHVGGWGFSRNVSDVKYPADVSPKHWDPVGNLTTSNYSTMTVPGVNQSFSPGYWNTLWVTAQTPWGIIVVGKRPFKFGPGLMFNGDDNASTETVLLTVPLGPMRFGFGWYPWRRQIDQGYVEPSRISHQYVNPLDKSSGRKYDLTGFLTYDAGSLSMGALTEAYAFSVGPEAVNDPALKAKFIPEQLDAVFGGVFLKYFDGRFFFNTEADWYYETINLQPNMNGNLTPAFLPIEVQGALTNNPYLFQRSYIEHWRYMVELGTLVGPAKLSLIWSWIPGTDRRHGVVIDRQNLRYDDLYTNSGVFRPYSMILVGAYGTGNNSVSAITNGGYLTDANAYGARLDYAIAANFNVFATFFWAERLSKGYGWGFIQPALETDVPLQNPLPTGVTTGFVQYTRKGSVTDPSPAIPDSQLGYELDWGFGWKLLEGYTLNGTFGYFQPGNWFKFACVDRSNPGWKTPSSANMFGINPNRSIDSIFAMDVSLYVEF